MFESGLNALFGSITMKSWFNHYYVMIALHLPKILKYGMVLLNIFLKLCNCAFFSGDFQVGNAAVLCCFHMMVIKDRSVWKYVYLSLFYKGLLVSVNESSTRYTKDIYRQFIQTLLSLQY